MMRRRTLLQWGHRAPGRILNPYLSCPSFAVSRLLGREMVYWFGNMRLLAVGETGL
jgi:hypothetical protein